MPSAKRAVSRKAPIEAPAIQLEKIVNRRAPRILLDHGPYGDIVKAAGAFKTGERIFYLSGDIIDHPTKYTIQLDEHDHVLTRDSMWQSMNHGCEPNVRIDVEKREMVAARPIKKGEEFNFNYNTTEWAMASPFPCGCGAPTCAGEIRGFKYLTEAQRAPLRDLVSPYIARRWAEAVDTPAPSVRTLRPEVQLLAPYMIENGVAVSPDYDVDSFRNELKGWFEPLNLDYVWHPVTLGTIDEVVARLEQRMSDKAIVVLNLCDGSEDDGYPGKSLVTALARAGLPYSGAGSTFYEVTTSKLATKRLLRASGVSTGEFVVIEDAERDLPVAVEKIGYPLFIKPDISAGSYGISLDSVCYDLESARAKAEKLQGDKYFYSCAVFAEPFIDGREFTVLVVEDPTQPLGLYVLPPGERVFDKRVPANERFLAYERYWELPEEQRRIPEGEPYYWYRSAPDDLREEIATLARRAVRAVDGAGYARVDIRRSEKLGKLFVLEVNAQCGLSTDDSSTVGSLLNLAGKKMSEMMERVLDHALTRARRPNPHSA